MKLLDYSPLKKLLNQHEMPRLAAAIDTIVSSGLDVERYGDIPRWQQAVTTLPDLKINSVDLASDMVSVSVDLNDDNIIAQQSALRSTLMALHPWRKGPFSLAGVVIDTEWRSDFKWQRLIKKIVPLAGKRVLDVGCGSGYHCWRMAGEGADLVIGIDPIPLFVMQYWALQKYLQQPNVWVLPTRMKSLPAKLGSFDSVFSMGVMYHRRSPFDHLQELRDALVDGGQLILETLVIDGSEGQVLVPEGRYSKMGNVWFIPSVATLCQWLRKMKFSDIQVVDVSTTTAEEQRQTEWMTFHSLTDFLDPDDMTKTVEGYPAPQRAVVVATV